MKTETVYQVAMDVAQKSGLLKLLKDDQTPEGVSRMENIQELMNSLQGFIEEQQQLEDGDPAFLISLKILHSLQILRIKTMTTIKYL